MCAIGMGGNCIAACIPPGATQGYQQSVNALEEARTQQLEACSC